MRILAIDTSHPVGSISLTIDGDVAGSVRFGSAASHLVELGVSAARLIEDAGLDVSRIDRLALVTGPGSFTGLRIGMSYVKGLYAAMGTEVVTATSLKLLARQTPATGEVVCSMIDARRDEVYTAAYVTGDGGVGKEIVAPHTTVPAEFVCSLDRRATTFVGTGALRYREQIESTFVGPAEFVPEEENFPSTPFLGKIAGDLTPLTKKEVRCLEPFYIRPSDAKLKKIEER
ncbi:MAG: tRNA (adenosine(37)-N6)-threonylcarbamoyltransferase complex dimerization subunit type 1 TsaB [bacterium]|nr:tRNA (adenosine(37)-N6)-threonylcarbamoyltransferase complex dimerization subunit type 1 TsaB [bacterium]